jgi:sporulation-control protein spo0M
MWRLSTWGTLAYHGIATNNIITNKVISKKFTIGPNPMRDFSISLELAENICLTVDNHSSYVQQ